MNLFAENKLIIEKEPPPIEIGEKVLSTINSYSNDFIAHCQKLKQQGCNSISKEWWLYRFAEFLKCNEDSKTAAIYEAKKAKYDTFNAFWQLHWKSIIDARWHHLTWDKDVNISVERIEYEYD